MIGGDFSILEPKTFPEEELHAIAGHIRSFRYLDYLALQLIEALPARNRNYDWNVGSILQHLDMETVLSALARAQSPERLYNSIGLAWVLGEFRSRNRIIVDFLRNIVFHSSDSEAWWRAAFSLEKIGIEDAVNLLKRSTKADALQPLQYYLERLEDKRSVICILTLSTSDNIERVIYPKVKKIFLASQDRLTVINCCWLIGRLRLIDEVILRRLVVLMRHRNYELKYYTFFALQNNATESLRPLLEKAVLEGDPLIRKMSARGLLSIGSSHSLPVLERALLEEDHSSVIAEISRAIYHLRNPRNRKNLLIEIKSFKNENGMIADESDKWYADPAIYHIFSEAEDPENICFTLIEKKIEGRRIENPIDLGAGTGRMLWQVLDKVPFSGTLYGVDMSKSMCEYVERVMKRDRRYTRPIEIVASTIKDAPKRIPEKSSFIISSFGFPSRASSREICAEELRAVHDLLSEDGLFFTIGWDETFNDELNEMWYRFVPDRIQATDFEEWRRKRAASFSSPRNCHLTWFKRGIHAPLQFSSLKDAACVMGNLFGSDAAQFVVQNNKLEWSMALGITCNTKDEIAEIIKEYA